MLKVLHSILQFIWHNLIGICIWIWMLWVTINMIDTKERLDRMEKANGLIIEWIRIHGDLQKDIEHSQPMDTIPYNPFGNSDGKKLSI